MNKLKPILGILGVLALLVFVGYFVITKHQSTSVANRDKYASAYEAKALKEPFNILSKQFENNSWLYVYQSNLSTEESLAQAKLQLTGGGYQVVSSHPDTSDTIYRDLITGDINVKAVISKTPSGFTGIAVSVTGIGKE